MGSNIASRGQLGRNTNPLFDSISAGRRPPWLRDIHDESCRMAVQPCLAIRAKISNGSWWSICMVVKQDTYGVLSMHMCATHIIQYVLIIQAARLRSTWIEAMLPIELIFCRYRQRKIVHLSSGSHELGLQLKRDSIQISRAWFEDRVMTSITSRSSAASVNRWHL